MRGVVITTRSKFWGLKCEYCAKKLKVDEPVLATTLFIDLARSLVRHQRRGDQDLEVRLTWHRRCMDRIMTNTPEDAATAEFDAKFEAYRQSLLEGFIDG